MNLTNHGFFPNLSGIDCTVCSVSNLILKKFNDLEMAAKFYLEVYRHELVGGKQVKPFFLPFLIEDITQGKYGATFFLDNLEEYQSLRENLIERMNARKDVEWGFSEEVIKYSVERRLIQPWEDFCLDPPSIGIFQTGFEQGHTVVDLGEKVINDGYLVNWVNKPNFLYGLRIGKSKKIDWTSLNQIPL